MRDEGVVAARAGSQRGEKVRLVALCTSQQVQEWLDRAIDFEFLHHAQPASLAHFCGDGRVFDELHRLFGKIPPIAGTKK